MATIYYLEGEGKSLSSFVILWFNPLWSDLVFLDKTYIIHLYKMGKALLTFYTVDHSDGKSVALLS